MKLYHKYNFYALYDDLFITCFDSDIRKCDELSEIKKWNWNMNNYFNINNRKIKHSGCSVKNSVSTVVKK